jgi:L-rhamnose-H+ transport protein
MDIFIGLLLALIGGGVQGAFFFPMKSMRGWRWENGWFVFSLVGCLILPALLAFLTTPDLISVYAAAGWKTAGVVFLFGLCWGVGAVLYGLGVDFLGMAMGVTVITGINACLGTLLPVLFLKPGTLTPWADLALCVALAVIVVGVAVISMAGRLREREAGVAAGVSAATRMPFYVGLIVCIASGVLCPAFNFAVHFGQPISVQVRDIGTVAPYNYGNAMLLLFFLGGWVVNTLYCCRLFLKNRSAGNFLHFHSVSNSFRGILMSVLFVGGAFLYTIAVTFFSSNTGTVVGWPVFLSATIIVSTLLGVTSGEWKHVRRQTLVWLYGGIAMLIVAVVLASLSNS